MRQISGDLLPLTTYIRRNLGAPALWENFEYLALLSKRFVETHPAGAYPRGEPRLPEDDSLIRALAGTPAAKRLTARQRSDSRCRNARTAEDIRMGELA